MHWHCLPFMNCPLAVNTNTGPFTGFCRTFHQLAYETYFTSDTQTEKVVFRFMTEKLMKRGSQVS